MNAESFENCYLLLIIILIKLTEVYKSILLLIARSS